MAAAVSFTLYEQFKRILKWNFQTGKADLKHFRYQDAIIPLAAGGTARLFGTAFRTPFDLIKQRLQVQGTLKEKQYTGPIDALKKVWKYEGVRGLFTGYIPSLFRDVPFAALYFCTYETMKSAQYRLTGRPLTSKNHLLAGATAGAIGSCATIPFDVVKTRLQTQATLPRHEQRYKGVIPTLKLIYKEEGARGLTRGLIPRLIYIVPTSSITFTCYEKFKKLFRVT